MDIEISNTQENLLIIIIIIIIIIIKKSYQQIHQHLKKEIDKN